MNKSIDRPRYYILVGDETSWKTALEYNQWGFSKKNIGLWNTIMEGELVAFYATKPIQKIIGFGKISEKFTSNDIMWPDEKIFNKSLWENRIKFKIMLVTKNWNDGIDPPKNMMLNIGRKVIEKKVFCTLINKAKKKWKI
ncbi:MAG: hypothetical protein K5785_09245 [Nitrosarchaeum sp.]|nr:hypothetical protein [Nitrosarchaeum sp.]